MIVHILLNLTYFPPLSKDKMDLFFSFQKEKKQPPTSPISQTGNLCGKQKHSEWISVKLFGNVVERRLIKDYIVKNVVRMLDPRESPAGGQVGAQLRDSK